MMQEIKRGDIFYAYVPFSNQCGGKTRPIVIVSNDKANATSAEVIGVAVSESDHRIDIPSNVPISSGGVNEDSVAKCATPIVIAKDLLGTRLGALSAADLMKVDLGLAHALQLSCGVQGAPVVVPDRSAEEKLAAYRKVLRDFMSA